MTGMPPEKARVLVVDDEPQITRVLRTVLTNQGYQVRTASEGESALSNFAEFRPELVITDLYMPHMNGLQAARQIARRQPETPLLLLTVQQVSKELTKEAVLAGFKGAVSKSTGSEVVRAIEMLLNREPYFDSIRADAYRRPA